MRKKLKKSVREQRRITQVAGKVSRRKKIRTLLSVLVLITIMSIFVFGDRGSYRLFLFWKQKNQISAEIQNLQNENKQLEVTKEKLKTDPAYIEKVAREKYKMKKQDEQVYQVVEE